MLQNAFQRGTISWCAPYGHICWVDENGTPYDIYGVCDSECVYFIPVSYIQEGLADFLHIPGKKFDASELYIQYAISKFESDLITSAGIQTDWETDDQKVVKMVKILQEIIASSMEEDVWFSVNDNFQIRIEIFDTYNGSTEAVSTLYSNKKEEMISTVCNAEDTKTLEKNILALLRYANGEKKYSAIEIQTRNISYNSSISSEKP